MEAPRWATLRLAACAAMLCGAACSNPNADDSAGRDYGHTDGHDGTGADADADADADVGGGDEATARDYSTDNVCAAEDINFHHGIVRIMLLLDQSSSMQGSSWNEATDALRALLNNPAFADMYFGLDAFPDGYPGLWADCGALCMRCSADECGTDFPPQVAVAINATSAPDIIAHMDDPAYPQFCTFTPLVNELAYWDTGAGATDAPEMYSGAGDSYLLIVSDGEDEGCFSGDAVSALASHTTSILTTHNIKLFAIGLGASTGTLADELNAIASHGGTSFTHFLPASDGPSLTAALESLTSSVVTCNYVIDDPGPSADPDQVNFYFDGVAVPMDEGCTETTGAGWHWVDDAHTTVEFCGDYCTQVKDGTIGTITATFGCPTILI